VLRMAVVTVLIMVNLVLLFLLFRPDRHLKAQPTNRAPDGHGPAAATSLPPPSSPSASSNLTTGALTDPTSSSRSVEPTHVERLLFAMSSKTAWRATVGDCGIPGRIELSTNGGSSWKHIVETGPAPIVRLGAESSGQLFTIGGSGQSCSARYVTYDEHGTVIASRNGPSDVWYPTPGERDEVNAPGGRKSRPCKGHIVGLAFLDSSRALAACADGAAVTSSDSGSTWRRVARLPNTIAVAAGNGHYWLARSVPDCDGIAVQSVTVNGTSSSHGSSVCAPAQRVTAGDVALDVSHGSIWLWAGSKTQISTDSGLTWT
jgi:hypothetical protein